MSDNIEIISEVIGHDKTVKMMQSFGGQYLYIPKHKKKREVIIQYIRKNFDGQNRRKICRELNIGQTTFYKYLRDI